MGFVWRRLGTGAVTMFLVSIFCFGAFRLIPGDAALLSLGTEATEEQIETLRREMGLDKSPGEQYFTWLRNFLTGNLGGAARFRGASVSGIITERLAVTFCLAGLSFIFMILIAVPVSLFSVKKETSFASRFVTFFTALGISMPGFFLGIILIWIFGITLKLFVPGAFVSYRENLPGFLGCLVFPALAIALPNGALLVKFLRAFIFKEFQSDYVRTARSKGGSRPYILRNHVLKNASIPSITLLGMISAEIFSGSIVTEQVFGIPGIGRLLLVSIASRDYPMVQTIVVYITAAVILANTFADIIIQIADPRIRIAGKA